ncbi:MAG: 16S rRNA (guanine(966)-N(2))-methyltransferase RsmD [Bacilli bacterium]
MIRIIAGVYKGRFLKVPDTNVTRPTMDKVRQAIFSAMKDKCLGNTVVDLFSGSGAMGLEALSRGAKMVYFNDKDHKTFLTMKENITSLKPDASSYCVTCMDYRVFLKKNTNLKIDVLFLDPPYRFTINASIIKYCEEHKMLNPDALVVSEQDYPNEEIPGYTMKEYRYGEKHVALYRKENI